jgi:hypothetical protein
MRISAGIAMTGKVLAAVADAAKQQAVVQALGQQRDHARIRMEGTIADHG